MVKQLLIRNTRGGMIWQVYNVKTQFEIDTLSTNAALSGYQFREVRDMEDDQAYEETAPGWRNTDSWKYWLKLKGQE